MVEKNNKKSLEKKGKENYSFTLSPDLVSKLNNKIGYTSRSQVVENLILEFIQKKESSTTHGKAGGRTS